MLKLRYFFLAFIPQFVNHALPMAPQFALLGVLCVCLNTAVGFLVVLLASRFSRDLRNSPKPPRFIAFASGSVLVGLGTFLGLSDSRRQQTRVTVGGRVI